MKWKLCILLLIILSLNWFLLFFTNMLVNYTWQSVNQRLPSPHFETFTLTFSSSFVMGVLSLRKFSIHIKKLSAGIQRTCPFCLVWRHSALASHYNLEDTVNILVV
jgi:hypothetical protein